MKAANGRKPSSQDITIRLGRRRMRLVWKARCRPSALLGYLLRRSLRSLFGAAAALMALACAPAAAGPAALDANALPAGGHVVAGQAAISQAGAGMNIVQGSDKAILDWSSFNIGRQATVNFQQPGASSAALNRVLGNDPSALLGRLSANGRVWLINPAGIMVGPGARIDVGGFVASTLNVKNEDFLAGRLNFQAGAGAGNVQNQGRISAARGGTVYLVAPSVENSGVVTAPNGEVLLAAGHSVQLVDTETPGVQIHVAGPEGKVTNLGSIVSEAGRVGLAGALLKNSGGISAASAVADGGRIFLKAARGIELEASSVILADGANGGDIIARVEQDGHVAGSMQVDGVLSARANAPGGQGGQIETSAARVGMAPGVAVSTASATGRTGRWLIDPSDYNIGGGPQQAADISGADLGANLQRTNVTIDTTSNLREPGDIAVNEPVSWTSGNSLTLNAVGSVNVRAPVSGPGSIINLRADLNGACTSFAEACSTVNIGPGATITAATTNIFYNFSASDTPESALYRASVFGSLNQWRLINDMQQFAGIIPSSQQNYALGRDIDAGQSRVAPLGNAGNPFRGVFDGNGHRISNLTISATFSDSVGLFSRNSGTIRNLGIAGAAVNGHSDVGILAGRNNPGGVIDSVNVSGRVINTAPPVAAAVIVTDNNATGLGGLVGANDGAISNSFGTVTVSGINVIGGLVGANGPTGSIDSSFIGGTVTGASNSYGGAIGVGTDVGGLAGINEGRISGSHNAGAVTGLGNVGGLAGRNAASGIIERSFSQERVSNDGASSYGGTLNNTGGLVGLNDGTISLSYSDSPVAAADTLGGFAGRNNGAISLSYSTGSVSAGTASGEGGTFFAGGFTGRNAGRITNAYSSGAVSGALGFGNSVGGFAGVNSGSLASLYTTSAVESAYGGGLVGINQPGGVISGGYWDLSRKAQSAGGTGLSPGQMQQQSSFTGFDFAGAWRIYDGHTTPLLKAFLTPLTVSAAPAGKVYDTLNTSFTGQASYAGLASDIGAPEGTLAYGAGGIAVNAGVYSLGGLWSTRYDIDYAAGSELTISRAPLQVSGIAANNKVYDGTRTATLSGAPAVQALGRDSVSVAGAGSALFADKNAGVGKPVSVSGFSLAGPAAGNYALQPPGGLKADIAPLELAVTGVGAADKPFDGTTAATLTGTPGIAPASGDQVALINGGRGRFADPQVGERKPVLVEGYALGGADAGNYVVRQPEGITAAIRPLPAEPPPEPGPLPPGLPPEPGPLPPGLPPEPGPLPPGLPRDTEPALVAAIDRSASPSPAPALAPLFRLPESSLVVDKTAPLARSPQRFLAMEEQRRRERTALYAQALDILKANPAAADLRPCPEYARPDELCMPAPLEAPQAVAVAGSPAGTGSPQAQQPGPAAALPAEPMPQAAPATAAAPEAVSPPLRIRRKVAYLIGNNAYKRPIPRLLTPIGDVKAVAAKLRDRMDYEVSLMPNATKADMVRLFKAIAEAAARDDSVLVFYAGHGYETDDRQGYWIPVDASPDDPSTWISNSDVSKFLARIPARQVILISDSCYSGTLASEERIDPGRLLARRNDILGKRSVTVMSSGGDEPVSDKGKEGHSIFAWNLLSEIGKIDDSRQGARVFQEVKAKVMEEYPQSPQYGAMPSAGHDPGGDYLLEKGLDGAGTATQGGK